MNVPDRGMLFQRLIEHLRLAQEDAAMIAHLHQANSSVLIRGAADKERVHAMGWLTVSEGLKLMQANVIKLGQGRMQ